MIRAFVTVFAALAGLAFGSFLNVCLSRWPEGESVVKPRSHCRSCGRTLTWWENIPLLSWLALRGHCCTCKATISWRYPLVELTVGALWAVQAWHYLGWVDDPNDTHSIAYLVLLGFVARLLFSWLLVALAMLDTEHLWLPDWFTWPGIVIGFFYSLMPYYVIDRMPLLGLRGASTMGRASRTTLAILIAAFLILAIRWLYWLIRRREGIGLGDAKLMALLAAWLGLPGALLSFAIGVILGAVVGVVVLARGQRAGAEHPTLAKLPLGTFLCIGGIIASLWGQPLIDAYMRSAGLN
ncbi:MAG: prepilin peptidase [Terracidiphilus sp.]|nr:prepilin peptidase [Terracidiphilus sp.]